MSAHVSHIPELDDLIERGSPGKRATTLARMTAFFLDGASRFNDDHVRLFDVVFSRLIGEIESTARTELSRRLAPVGKAPIETVRRLAHDDDIAVAGPLLERADRLSDADLADIAASKGQAHLLAICARNRIAPPVTDVLLRRGDREVVHRLAENRGARLSDEGFCTLIERAKTDGVLAEKVLLRSDVPPRLFHDLLLTAADAVQRRLIASAIPARAPRCAARWRKPRMKWPRRLRRGTTRARGTRSRRYSGRASSTKPTWSTSRRRANTAKRSQRLRCFARPRSKWWIG